LLSLIALATEAAACQSTIAISARVCGALCDEARSTEDFTGMDCAIAARIRMLPVRGAAIITGARPLLDQCISFQASDNTPPLYRLADLFDTGTGEAHPLDIGHTPKEPFVVEISLYAPGSLPCMDDQPLVGLGRSGVVDLSRDASEVNVPLGCRDACEAHGNVQVQLLSLEDAKTVVAPPDDLSLGEIFAYETFTDTNGVCMKPPLSAHRGQFRPFALTAKGTHLDGTWVVDHSNFDGCTVISGTTNGGTQLSCLFDDATSQSTLQGFVISAAHLAAVQGFNESTDAQGGALVVRVLDPSSDDPNGSAIGAHVNYLLLSTLSEAEYAQDAAWSITTPDPTGTTAAGLGVAVIADAPTGPYAVTFADGSTRTLNAGGSEDPTAVTVVVVDGPGP
jgi:hypothetical protein